MFLLNLQSVIKYSRIALLLLYLSTDCYAHLEYTLLKGWKSLWYRFWNIRSLSYWYNIKFARFSKNALICFRWNQRKWRGFFARTWFDWNVVWHFRTFER